MTGMAGRPALGSATRGGISIMDLRDVWGAPRFYPPLEHPATLNLRIERDRLLDLMDRSPLLAANVDVQAALRYVQRKIGEWEAGEFLAKELAWIRLKEENRAVRQRAKARA